MNAVLFRGWTCCAPSFSYLLLNKNLWKLCLPLTLQVSGSPFHYCKMDRALSTVGDPVGWCFITFFKKGEVICGLLQNILLCKHMFSGIHWGLLGFWTCPSSQYSKEQCFGNWICFCPQVRGETPTLLHPLERAKLNHWTLVYTIVRTLYRVYQMEPTFNPFHATSQLDQLLYLHWTAERIGLMIIT
jgi:hypothetical protein